MLLFGLVLTACGGGDEETATAVPDDGSTTESADPTDTPEPEPEPTDTPEPEPTDTPVPPTVTPEPTAIPDPAAGFVDFESAEGGFSLKYPDGWFTSDLFGFAIFASAEELLDAPDPGEEGGVMIVISGAAEEFTADFDTTDPVEILGGASEDFGLGEDAEIVDGPTAITINDQDAAIATITATSDNDTPLTAMIVVILSEDRGAIAFGATPSESSEEFLPIFEAMANTIELTEPVETVDAPPVDGGGDVPATEGFLLFGDVMTGAVPADGVSAWDFIGLEGEVVDIIIEPLSEDLDVKVDVLNESGASVLDAVVDDSFGIEEVRELAISASGTYYVVVSGFSADDAGDYTITFVESGAAIPEGDGGETAVSGDLSYGAGLFSSALAGEASVSYTFGGNAGDIVRVAVDPEDDFDIVVDIVDGTGTSLLLAGKDNSFGTEVVAARLPETGEYAVTVAPFTEGESGSFDISLEGPAGIAVFASDSLEEEGAEHAFPFLASEGDLVFMLVEPEGELDVIVRLYNDDTDEELASFDRSFGFEGVGYLISEDANYYFQVVGFVPDEDSSEGGENIGEYSVTMLGATTTVFELAYGDSVAGQLATDDGISEYSLSGLAGDTITLTASSDENIDVTLEIVDLDGNSLADIDDGFSGEDEVLTYTFEADGLYVIRVSDFFGGNGLFELFVDLDG